MPVCGQGVREHEKVSDDAAEIKKKKRTPITSGQKTRQNGLRYVEHPF
jgi:hypothetical protein